MNPQVSAQELSREVDRFLRTTRANTNLTKKLSELVTAKALWFSGSAPIELSPGAKAIGGSDSPDYVAGDDIVGDNFRVEGVAPVAGQVELEPDPALHENGIEKVLAAVFKGIKSKVTTYFAKHVKKAGKKVVVTVDVSDCPWVLRQHHLSLIAPVANERADRETFVGQCLHAVYFVVWHTACFRDGRLVPPSRAPVSVRCRSGLGSRRRRRRRRGSPRQPQRGPCGPTSQVASQRPRR